MLTIAALVVVARASVAVGTATLGRSCLRRTACILADDQDLLPGKTQPRERSATLVANADRDDAQFASSPVAVHGEPAFAGHYGVLGA